jgi:hypothetical protein
MRDAGTDAAADAGTVQPPMQQPRRMRARLHFDVQPYGTSTARTA